MKTEDGSITGVAHCLVIAPSPIHGMGAFASRAIARGARVVEYTGEKISKAESLRRCEAGNWFIFSLDDEFDLDGNIAGNPARWLNHSCAPNCEAEFLGGRIWITASRDIAAGEEITFNYGYTLDEYREHPCRCGAPSCAGWIVAEEYFDYVKKNCCA
jgi:SET domain-containing protein